MSTPMNEVCMVCQRGPARTFAIRRHVGMLVLQRFVKLKAPLCRDHALEITKSFLLKTLWQGWWGYISVFVNVFVLISDLVVLGRARTMPVPVPVVVSAPKPQQLDPAEPGPLAEAG